MLTVKGRVEVVAGFDPERLNLGQVKMGTSVSQQVRIVGSQASKMKLGEAVSSHPEQLKVEKDAADPLKYNVTFTAPEKAGSFSGQVKVKTGLEAPEEITLFVFGQVAADIVADRQFAYFSWLPEPAAGVTALAPLAAAGKVLSGGDAVVRIKLHSLSGQPFRVSRLEDPEGAVIGQARQVGPEWELALLALKRPSQANGMIRVHLDRTDQPLLEIRYLVRPAVGVKSPPANLPVPFPGGGGRPLLKAAPLLRKAPGQLEVKKVSPPPAPEAGK